MIPVRGAEWDRTEQAFENEGTMMGQSLEWGGSEVYLGMDNVCVYVRVSEKEPENERRVRREEVCVCIYITLI